MRSAFEAMMGALLGMLGAVEQMATGDSPSTGDLANVSDLPDGSSTGGLPTLLDGKATPSADGQPGQAAAPATVGQEATPGDGAGSQSATAQNTLPNRAIPSQESGVSPADSPGVKNGQPLAQTPAQASSSTIQQLAAGMDGANNEKSGPKSSPQPAPATKGDSNSSVSGMGFTLNSTAAPDSAAAPLKSDAPLPATPVEQISEHVQFSFSRGEQDATIQLHPKELGSVRIRLQMENGQLHLSIQADKQETGHLLNSKLAELRQSLEGQGIKVGDLAVARSERTLSTQTTNQPIAPATRSGQMDMNPNNSQPQRQQMAFAGGNFGNETFAGGQDAHRQQAGLHSSLATSGDILPVAERPLTHSVARGRTAVDYYA